MAHSTCR